MERCLGEHLEGEGVDRQRAGYRQPHAALVPPREAHEERPSLEVVGMVEGDLFDGGEKLRGMRLPLGVVLFLSEELAGGLDPALLARCGGVERRPGGAGDDLPGAGLVLDVRHRHPPVGHDAGRVDLEDRAERPLRLPVPKAVKLADPLLEIGLGLRRRGRNGEADNTAARREGEPAPRPRREALAMEGVARRRRGSRAWRVVGPGAGGRRRRQRCREEQGKSHRSEGGAG